MNSIAISLIVLTLLATNPLQAMQARPSEIIPKYCIYRATMLYTIFKPIKDSPDHLPFIISFKSINKYPKQTIFIDAIGNPNNDFINQEFEQHKKFFNILTIKEQRQFIETIHKQQAMRTIAQKCRHTPSFYLHQRDLRRYIVSKSLQNKPLPNPLIIEHIKSVKTKWKKEASKN